MTKHFHLQDFFPILSWSRGYCADWLGSDLIAGLTAAAVVVPKAMAYATIAGLPVQIGIYTVLVPMAIYAVFGTSRPLSVSTTTTIAVLTATALEGVVPTAGTLELTAASATLAVLVGATLLMASALRMGFVADFISEPVLTGFKSAIGLVIVVDQIPKLLGIHIQKSGFFRDLFAIVHQLQAISMPTLLLALSLLVVIFGLERFLPRVPAPLIAVGAAIGAVALLGVDRWGIATVGEIPPTLPGLMLPRPDLVWALSPAALGIALMSFTESIAAARAFGGENEPRPSPNQELLALGAANIAGGLFGAMPAGGGTTQTAVNRHAGARTQLAELITAAVALLTLLLLAPLIGLMPQAALAAVVVAYSVGLIEPSEFLEIRQVRRTEFYWALIAFGGVIILGTLQGIVVAVIASLLSLAQQAYSPPVYALARKPHTQVYRPASAKHPSDETWPGLLIVRIEGRLFFANAQRVGDMLSLLLDKSKPTVLLLDFSSVIDIEYTALKMLTRAEVVLRDRGTTLWLAALNPKVRAMIARAPLGEAVRRGRLFANLQVAVEHYVDVNRRS